MLIGAIIGFVLWLAYTFNVIRTLEPWEQLDAGVLLVFLMALVGSGFTMGTLVELFGAMIYEQ